MLWSMPSPRGAQELDEPVARREVVAVLESNQRRRRRNRAAPTGGLELSQGVARVLGDVFVVADDHGDAAAARLLAHFHEGHRAFGAWFLHVDVGRALLQGGCKERGRVARAAGNQDEPRRGVQPRAA